MAGPLRPYPPPTLSLTGPVIRISLCLSDKVNCDCKLKDLHRLKQQLSAAGIPQEDEILDLAGGPAQVPGGGGS